MPVSYSWAVSDFACSFKVNEVQGMLVKQLESPSKFIVGYQSLLFRISPSLFGFRILSHTARNWGTYGRLPAG